MHRRHLSALLAVAAAGLAAVPAASASEPTLIKRAILPADATFPAPFPGAPDTEPVFAPGSVQPVGGFSALTDAPGIDTSWAMPDNGFGNKANSHSFALRVYEVHADWKTSRGGSGTVAIQEAITLSDPDHEIPFDLVNEDAPERILTGGDFDIESVRQDRRGDLWFGDEFGPFLLHTDDEGKVLEAPIPLPDVKSPDFPAGIPAPFEGDANLASSNGFEGMALSSDGRRLYPTLEGRVAGDDPQVRRMYEFDLRRHRYQKTVRQVRVGTPGDPTTAGFLVSDLTALDRDHLVMLERDNGQGATAVWKRGFVLDLTRPEADDSLAKRQVVDLLAVRDPHGLSLPGRSGDIGLGDPFAMPYQTIEAVLPIWGDQLAIVNDTNFGSMGRNPALPDDSDFVQILVPGLRRG